MVEAVQQIKCAILEESREALADKLITLTARIKALKHGNYAWVNEFYGGDDGGCGFLEVFENLVARTAHEKVVDKARWNGGSLRGAIDEYFKNPYEKIDTGIALAREYFKVLITNGVINDHE